ncbi:MAG: FKBP-type peptidyl-prolyl cis-trans isomerase [Flavitalea sp.]
MRKLLVAVAAIIVLGTGCKKSGECSEDNTVAPQSEGDAIAAYLQTNGITATKFKTNLYYQIVTPGSGGSPNPCSTVQVAYRGTLTNGNKFDESTNLTFSLQRLIKGWIQGIPLIQKGGAIRLFVPPSLGYGSADVKDGGVVIIPGNSILIFDITLINFQ